MAETERDPAVRRFALMQVIRLACLAVVLTGAAIYVGKVGDSPEAGAVLLIAGAAGFFILPRMMARRWKSSGE